MTTTNTVKAKFTHVRSTKGTHLFAEIDERGQTVEIHEAVVGNLYVRKSKIGETAPKQIQVTIEVTN